MFHKPQKALSQNYLQDRNIARKICGMLKGKNADQIYEIGPGQGVLTEYLLNKFGEKLFLIEIDHDSVAWLKERFPELEDRIFAEDFLTFHWPEDSKDKKIALIGNFPYHITSPIFFRIIEKRDRVTEVVAMIQKEVAERLVSPSGTKTYGLLSVLLQTFYHVDYLFTVNEQVFYPRPKVKSAVIRLTRNEREELPCPDGKYLTLVKKAFGQRRKTLRNALKGYIPDNLLSLEILSRRAEQLTAREFVELCREVKLKS